MKILLISNRHFHGGGADTVYFTTGDILKKAGHEVIFFSSRRAENEPCKQEAFFSDHGGKLTELRNYFYNKQAAIKLQELIDVEKPDVAHVHLLWGGLSPSILVVLKRNNVPVVHTAHDYRMVCPAYLLMDDKGQQCNRCKGGKFYQCTLHKCSKGNFIESFIMTTEMYYRNRKYHPFKMFDGLIFVSNFSRNKHIEFDARLAKARTIILYNCPDDQVKDSLNTNLDTFGSYYLFYGRLSAEKGLSTLLRAFGRFPNLKLKIVGTGPLECELKQHCYNNKMKNVEFLGYKTGKELFDLVSKAKYVCVPSECYENNPMTIVEAYSLRTPVIGAAIGGISEIIQEGMTGFTFESGDMVSLCGVLEKTSSLKKEDYCRMKTNAYVFGNNNFSREHHLNKLLGFYKEVMKCKQNTR